MADKTTTSVKVSEAVWRELHNRKQLGDSMDDVLRRELGLDDDGDLPGEVADYLADLDVSDGERDAVEAMWRYVNEHAPASPQEIRENVHSDHQTGKDKEWWWKKLHPHLDDAPRIKRATQRRYEFV